MTSPWAARAALLTTLVLTAAAGAGRAAAAEPTRLLRFPDIHGDRVVFSYGGDLWLAPAAGGVASKLTSGPGVELFGKFSPDGRRIAFTAQYGGDEQVYVMPADGGRATQLTFYPASGPRAERWGYDNEVYGWTPDGKSILFRSQRDGWDYTDARLYTVAASGGAPVALPMPESGAGDYAPDGKRIVYSPMWRDFRTWKRYQGGWAQDLWIFDLVNPSLKRVTDNPRTDRDPMWIGGAIWFVSDRDGTLNLYRYDLASGATTQATKHSGADVRWASSDGRSQIVYELQGTLHVYDTTSNQDRALDIFVPDDGTSRRPERVSAIENLEQTRLAPGGERVALVARGDVFTLPASEGITRNLTQTSTAHERELAWAPDGKRLAYVSDATGEEEVWIAPHDGSAPARQLTKGSRTRYRALSWSPDGANLALSDKDGRILIASLASGALKQVADDPFEVADDYAWSPDGRYLAYSLAAASGFHSVYIYALADGRSTRVTDPMFYAGTPAWDPKGELLYFLSLREFQPQLSQVEFDFAANRATGIFAVALRPDVANPYGARSDEIGALIADAGEDKADEGDKDARKSKKLPKVTIDFDGIQARAIRVPLEADNYSELVATDKFLLTRRSDADFYGRDGAEPELLAYSIAKRKPDVIAGDVQDWSVTDDGKKVLVVDSDHKLKILDVEAEHDDDSNAEIKPLSTDGVYLTRVPAEEWRTIFNEAWRRYRDHFYAANMHGYDWNALRARYEPLLVHVAHRSDLNYVIGELIAELNVSHAYVQGGDVRVPERPVMALGGARFELDAAADRYKISRIFEGQNEEERYRSPLSEVGSRVRVGEYLLAVNGRELRGGQNPWELMQSEADQLAEWRVGPTPDGQNARTVRFKPLASEIDLLYLAFVRRNMARVERASNGRIGYLHLPDMGDNGIREFIKWWYPQLRREGLVVDVRSNGGGNVSAMLIERLSRRLLGLDYARTADRPTTYPSEVFVGPMVCILNETSGSDGDIFPYQFRNAGLGPLIGKRSWGGVVGITDRGPLLDGGILFVPEFGTADARGQWVIEGRGVEPDIEVEQDPFAVIKGGDPQLERGIAEVMGKLPKQPTDLPGRPADPVKAP